VRVRRAKDEDVPFIVEAFSRMYSLNSEFDPLLQVPGDLEDRVEKSIREGLKGGKELLVVAEDGDKLVGAARVKILEREFYVPNRVAVIEEIYVMPAYRRSGVGEAILDYLTSELKGLGVDSVTARFPAKNVIAVSFYKKRGFREIHYEFVKKL
jgi:ribosomal protein S18 acetylase RimI-like enzyme